MSEELQKMVDIPLDQTEIQNVVPFEKPGWCAWFASLFGCKTSSVGANI